LARGGAEQLLLDTVRHLDASVFEVDVAYVDEHPTDLLSEFSSAGCSLYWLQGHGRSGLVWMWRLRQLVREREIDIVHAHLPYSAVGARLSLGWTGPPIVYTEHGSWDFYRETPVTYWGNLLTYSRNCIVVAVSEYVAASVRYPRGLRLCRMPPVTTVYHGLDFTAIGSWRSHSARVRSELGLPDNVPVVGSVANFRPVKGHRYLLEAFRRVLDDVPEARLVLVGRGELERELRALADRLGLHAHVIFAGSSAHAARVMTAFDIFVLPSLDEGLPVALLEALSLGKACVVTKVGGVPEVITNGVDGALVRPGDALAIASALTPLLRDGSLRQQYGAAALARAADFDVRFTASKLEHLYAGLVRERRRSSV
jgi:glycosyltransferase involved in cell wall biosynthesis